MKKFKTRKSKKGKWYGSGWQNKTKSVDTYNTMPLNIPIIDIESNQIENLTMQVSEHLLSSWTIQFIFSSQRGREHDLKGEVYKWLKKDQSILYPLRLGPQPMHLISKIHLKFSFITQREVLSSEFDTTQISYLKRDPRKSLDLLTHQEISIVLDRLGKFNLKCP